MAPTRGRSMRLWIPTICCLVPLAGPAAAGSVEVVAATSAEPRVITVLLPADAVATAVEADGARVTLLGTSTWRGASLASVRVESPLPAADQLHVRVTTAPRAASDATLPTRRLRADPALDARDAAALRGRVANPEDVARLHPAPAAAPAKAVRRGFRPSSYPDLEGSPVRHLVITSTALANDFQALADWRTRRGVPSVVRTLDWVQQHARRGSDPAETLRNFLKDAYAWWGVDYVLLGGDTDVVPARYATSSVPGVATQVPTDLYYGCLDGTWNANRNGIWAEPATGAGNLGDQADLAPEVYVARAPVRTAAEVQLFVQKTIDYETPAAADYQNQALLLAEVLSPADYDSGQTITLDGAALSEALRTSHLPGSLAVARQYETHFDYPGATPLSRASALAALGAGSHFVNHMGHGFRYNMSVGTASIVNADADALANGDRTFVLYLLNCTALAYDSNSLGERFLMAPAGGAVAVIGASREAFPNNAIEYNEAFYDRLFVHGDRALGAAFAAARATRTGFTFFDTQDRWSHFIYNVLGDPGLTLFTGPVQPPAVTHAASVPLGTTSIAVGVLANGSPVEAATVCLWKGDEAYATGETDAAGDATLALRADTPGAVLVTVSGQDLATYLGTITVGAVAPAHPRVASAAVVDDGTAGTIGNGDALADAGETVRLVAQVANAGGTAIAARARLASPLPQVVVLADSVELGTLAPEPAPAVAASFLVQLDAGIADATTVPFTIQFRDTSGVSLGTETLPKLVHAPRLEVVEVVPTPAGPTTTFDVVLKNFGSGAQPALTGTLASADPDVAVTQGAASVGAIASFATGTTTPPLVVTEATTTQRNRMQLHLADAYGRTLDFEFDLRAPPAAARPTPDASQGPTLMRLTWTPSAVTDVVGYHVFRRPSAMGGLVRVSVDVVRQAYFLDAGLAPSTRYDWAVASVDSSGLVGALSPVATASTNPPQLAGWPLVLPASTSSSVALGDIDGDGDLEIVAGDEGIYAWHHTGAEIHDGDSNAATWGALTGDAAVVTGAVALGNCDPARPGLEIVRANWADSRVTVYDGQGNALPGWPQQPANGTPGYWGTPTAADLDGDGRAEVLVVGKDGRLYGWHGDGTPLGGGDGTLAVVGGFTRTSPTVVNLDGDPQLEILVAGSDGFLRALESDGTPAVVPFGVWPVNLGAVSLSSPAVGEIDGNPHTPEIVVTSENDFVHVLNVRGEAVPGWPKAASMDSPSFGPSPAVADLNGDGRDEIVVVANDNPAVLSLLVVYDGASGAVLLTKLLGNISESSPILADVDGNGSIDVVVGGESGVINAWSLGGQQLDGFPLTVNDFVRSTPFFGDVDGDGGADLVLAGWDRTVYVWDLAAPYVPARAPWPTYCRNAARTGNRIHEAVSDPGGPDDVAAVPAVLRFRPNVPNPFNPATALHLEVPAAQIVEVAVFDARGKHVRTLHHGWLGAGRHALVWDGRDAGGRAVPSGVYWSRARAAGLVTARKLTLMK
jgi:hypothetical protein